MSLAEPDGQSTVRVVKAKIPSLRFLPLLAALFCALAPCSFGTNPLPRSSPEAQGVSSAAIRAYVEEADKKQDTMHSFMLVRHGHVVAEGWWKPDAADKPHVLYSLSKSFTSTAVGLAVAEGKLSVDDPVLKFFPDDAPAEPSANLKAMRVRDLLTMSRGHDSPSRSSSRRRPVGEDVPGPARAVQAGHAFPLQHARHATCSRRSCRKSPGRPCSTTCSPRLFEPLGIENPEWEASPQGDQRRRLGA